MSKIFVISDIHESKRWRKMLEPRKKEDEVVFLGDYFDKRGKGAFARSSTKNFLDICDYAKNDSGVKLLIGNHDYNYTPWCQAYIPWNDEKNAIRKVLMQNIDLLEMVYIHSGFSKPLIFSHGGLTQTFMDINGLTTPEQVNQLWRQKPENFDWIPRDPITGTPSNSYGDDPWQSPIWARTEALYYDAVAGYNQVVGHTPVRRPQTFTTNNGDEIMLTCTLDEQEVILETR